jgi:hypothetical protein
MRRILGLLALAGTLFVFPGQAWSQCVGTYNAEEGWIRLDGNTLYSFGGAYITGNSDSWTNSVSETVYLNGSSIHSGSDSEPGTALVGWTDTLQTIGPGTFSELVHFAWTDNTHSACSATYDLTPADVHELFERPTISGFCCGMSFWNLGDGSSDPQPTNTPTGPGSYVQSVALTFVSNCPTCTSTPTWSLSTSGQQTQLPGGTFTATGATTTISKGSSNYATCSVDSVLTAAIDGFSTANYGVIVDGPGAAYNISYGGIGYQETSEWDAPAGEDGYNTEFSEGVLDVCGTQYMYPVPMAEAFGFFFYHNGASGYGTPPGASFPYWDYTDWDNSYIFTDSIGQCSTDCGGAPSPNPTFTHATPPYTYNTLSLDGTHYFYAGSTTAGSGVLVYSGKIEYFQDHGDNNP